MTTTHPSSPAAAATSPRGARAASRLVIDAPVRAVHWLLAASFAGAWLSAESEQWRALHNTLGYLVLGLLAFRLVYGLAGPRPARLGVWWRKLLASPAWWRSLREPGASWRPAQNVAMAATVLGVAVALLVAGLSGWGLELDGSGEWLEEVHEAAAEFSLVLVLAHLAALAVLSALRGRNQALPMLTGRQPGPGVDVVRPRRALAAAVLAAAAAFVAWQWQQSPEGLWPTGGDGPASAAAWAPSDGPYSAAPHGGEEDDDDEDDEEGDEEGD